MLNPLNHHYAMENPASVYDEEALTALELAGRTTAKVNETVNAFNDLETETNKHLENQDKTIETRLGSQDAAIKKMNDETMPAKVTAEVQRKIDSGEFDSAINVYASDLESRVDNLLGKVVEGSTTGDAELIDARVDHTGKTHANVGEAIRSVTEFMSNITLEHFNRTIGCVPIAETGYGYRAITNTTTGATYEQPSTDFRYVRSAKTPCKPGDVFLYYGKTGSNAPSAFFYEGNVYTGGYVISEVNTRYYNNEHTYFGYAEITIPDGCNYVVFQSIANQSLWNGDPLFRCQLIDKNTIKNRLDVVEQSVSGLIGRYVNTNYKPVAGVYQSGFYFSPESDSAPLHAVVTDKISCYPGDVFKWVGVARGTVPAVFYFNGDKCTGATTPPGNVTAIQNIEFTIPEGCTHVVFQSFASSGKDVTLSVTHKDYKNLYQLNEELESKATGGNVLYGKKYVACGDSFTEGIICEPFTEGPFAGKRKNYPNIIGNRNGMEVVDLSVGGMTMCNVGGTRSNAFSNEKYKTIPLDADYIILKFGINDLNQSAPIGTATDTVTTTYCGAWNTVLEYILTNMPYAKVGIIITNGTSVAYADATREMAKRWGIPYLDEYAGDNVPLLHRVNRDGVCDKAKELRRNAFIVSEEDTHPNGKAHEYESTFVEHFMKSL